jgi:hypothetical protein
MGTPKQTIRVDEDLWQRFGEAAVNQAHVARAVVLRDFMRWYAGDPDAQMPRRPGGPARERPSGTP